MLFGDHCFLSLKRLIIGDNVVDSNFHEKEKKKKLPLDILVDSSLRNPVGKEHCSSCSVYVFLWGEKPCPPWRVGVFVCVAIPGLR